MKKIIKLPLIVFLLVVVALGGFVFFFVPRPPKEAKLIQNFNEHRDAFEQLRNMLQTDEHLRKVASWGVETTKPFFRGYPTERNLPIDRYNQYLALLKQAGGLLASRSEGEHADPNILVWVWGWAGDTTHIGICWMDQAPTNQIANLDDYRSPHSQAVFRHIDENWYLWSDW